MSPYRNRAESRRLWDEDGQEWLSGRDSIGNHAEIERLVAIADRAVVIRAVNSVRWLTGDEVRAYWNRVKTHSPRFDVRSPTTPDAEGLTYTADVWKRSGGSEELLGFYEHC